MSETCVKKISVVIPVYNNEKNVSNAITSILSQKFQNFELIIVNDGSTDNTEEVVKKIKDERIKYIKQENKGASSARNRGIQEASGEYIAFLDADDYWSSSHLSDHINFLEKHPDSLMTFNRYITVEKGVEKPYMWNNKLSGNIYPKLLFIENNIIGTPCVVLRKEILKKSGIFDESMSICEDLDLWRRISKLGKVGAISKPSTYVVLREGQFEPDKYLKSRYAYIKKAIKEDPRLNKEVIAQLILEMCIFYLSSGCSLNAISQYIIQVSEDFPEVEKSIQERMEKADVKFWLKMDANFVNLDKNSLFYKLKYGFRLIRSQGIIITTKNIFSKLKK